MATGNFFTSSLRTVTLQHVYQGLEKPAASQFKANSLIWDTALESWFKNVGGSWVAATFSGSTPNLGDLTDVTTTGATDGQSLVYDVATGKWGPATVESGSGSATNLNGLTDVTIVSPSDNDVIYYDASTSTWRVAAISSLETYSSASGLLTAMKTVDGSGSELDSDTLDGKHASDLEAETLTVNASRNIANSDHNNVLVCTGTITLTLPSSLNDDTIVMVLVSSGTTTIEAGSGSTLAGGNFELNASDGTTVATLVHETGGQWYAIAAQDAAPKTSIVSVSTSHTISASDDGAIFELADSATVTTGGSLSAGFACTIVRTGATAGTVARGTGHTLYGPGGNAASFTIDNQWGGASLYSRGSDVFVLLGAVT